MPNVKKFKLPKINFGYFKLKRNSIKTKLIIFVCLMSFIVVLLLAGVNYFSLSAGISSTVDQVISPLSTEAASDLSGKISLLKIKSQIVLQKTLGSSGIGTSKSALSYLKYMFNENELEVTDFALFKMSDFYIGSDRFSEADTEALQSLYVYQEAKLNDAAAISEPMANADGTGFEFAIAVPGTSNVTNYMLIMFFDAQVLSDIVDSIQFSDNSSAYIINADGKMIASSDIQNVLDEVNYTVLAESDSKYSEIAELQNLALSGEVGAEKIRFNGVKSRVAYSPIDDSKWAVMLISPDSDFNGTLNITTIILIVISVVLVISAFICTFIIMNGVVNPIIMVTERLKGLSDGDLSSETPVILEKNEIGVLSESLAGTVNSLRAYIQQISSALTNISQGNLAFEMDGRFEGDFVEIKESFNSILAQLRKTFGNISNSANTVSVAASQMASGAQLLSDGATRQSIAVNEVSSRMETIVEYISGSSKAASKTEELAGDIREQIDSCNREMSKMLESMDDISKSSAQISDIIQVIDDIAFQTNILALNAAVEAARAGDAGLGFAVVADEVRNLANMSADAAKQTSQLIEDSLRNVKRGTVIAKTTADSLDKIVLGATEINDKVKDIAESAEHQNKLISDIYESVNSVTAVIDNTTSTAEESSASAADMSDQAEVLRDMIDFFKIDFEGGDPVEYTPQEPTEEFEYAFSDEECVEEIPEVEQLTDETVESDDDSSDEDDEVVFEPNNE